MVSRSSYFNNEIGCLCSLPIYVQAQVSAATFYSYITVYYHINFCNLYNIAIESVFITQCLSTYSITYLNRSTCFQKRIIQRTDIGISYFQFIRDCFSQFKVARTGPDNQDIYRIPICKFLSLNAHFKCSMGHFPGTIRDIGSLHL